MRVSELEKEEAREAFVILIVNLWDKIRDERVLTTKVRNFFSEVYPQVRKKAENIVYCQMLFSCVPGIERVLMHLEMHLKML